MTETVYTLLDDGTYQEKLDILYAPGTVFYTKNANDDGYSPIVAESTEVQESENTVEAAPAVEITLEQMIATGKAFLEKQGYRVLTPDEQNANLNQIPADPKAHREFSPLLDKLRTMVASHFPSHALVGEAHAIIDEMKSKI